MLSAEYSIIQIYTIALEEMMKDSAVSLPFSMRRYVKDIDGLQAVFVLTFPDGNLYSSWTSPHSSIDTESTAGYLGDLIRANRKVIKQLDIPENVQITIESQPFVLLVKEINKYFDIVTIFNRSVSLGIMRMELKNLIEQIEPHLKTVTPSALNEGVKLINFLKRYSIDTHVALDRLSLVTGIDVSKFHNPMGLTEEEIEKVREGVKYILGLQKLPF